jgi:hypothetical protein
MSGTHTTLHSSLLSFFVGTRGEDDDGNLVGGAFAKAIVDDIL